MAIDPKELRIGSHINVSNERVVVDEIINDSLVAYIKPNGVWEAIGPVEDRIEPILITSDLLTELGFRKHEEKDKWIKCGDPYIEFTNLIDDRWGLLISPFDDTYNAIHRVFVRYLHQAELFLYLTTKQELIND